MLVPVTDAVEVGAAMDAFEATMTGGATRSLRSVGYRGGGGKYDVYWRSTEQIWSHFGMADSRYWCVFGSQDPAEHSNLSISCEVNPPLSGVNRQCAGLVMKDASGRKYIGHTGKIGGGKTGVGKSAFFEHYTGALEPIVWPDGREDEIVLIGRVDGAHLPRQLAQFMRVVERIKAGIGGTGSPPDPLPQTFGPEFAGKKASYQIAGIIESRADHGLIVNALHQRLQKLGIAAVNDRARDLYVASANGNGGMLFEVKTSVDPGSIYTGIGQLMFHGAKDDPEPKRVLVVPEETKDETKEVLGRLGIQVLTFRFQGNAPVFENLEVVVK